MEDEQHVADRIVLPMAELKVTYGYEMDGTPVVAVDWRVPESDRVPDRVIRAGLLAYLQEMEINGVWDDWEDGE